jgi:hypothetical protein
MIVRIDERFSEEPLITNDAKEYSDNAKRFSGKPIDRARSAQKVISLEGC